MPGADVQCQCPVPVSSLSAHPHCLVLLFSPQCQCPVLVASPTAHCPASVSSSTPQPQSQFPASFPRPGAMMASTDPGQSHPRPGWVPAPLPAPSPRCVPDVCQCHPPSWGTQGSHQQTPGPGNATPVLEEAESFNPGISRYSSRKEAVMGSDRMRQPCTAWCGAWGMLWGMV